MEQVQLYQDIAARTNGDIYIGVVGPVRTGKSTFISRFMDLLVIPNVENPPERARMIDEKPQSGAGKTIMTTQPKFVPNQAARLKLRDSAEVDVRLVDCVGYLIKDAQGFTEDGAPRMVRTPWFDHDIPFEQAAEMGTRKVIAEHSTLGVVVLTDGTITDIPREAYQDAEKRVVTELKALNKPFVIVLNSKKPDAPATKELREQLNAQYAVPVMSLDVMHMSLADVNALMESVLFEFPITRVVFDLPDWVDALPEGHWLGAHIYEGIRETGTRMNKVRDLDAVRAVFAASPYVGTVTTENIALNEGAIAYNLPVRSELFYQILGETCGETIEGEGHLLRMMKEMTHAKREYDRVADALESVRTTGYGLVPPVKDELELAQPQIVKRGGHFGVQLKASAPSLHMIRVDINTEVSPLVGTEKQSQEMVDHLLSEFEAHPEKIWDTDLFGKSLNDLVNEGLAGKSMKMPEEARIKIQNTLQRIINHGNANLICILI